MEDKEFTKLHMRPCLLHKFRKRRTTTEALKNIWDVCQDAVKFVHVSCGLSGLIKDGE